MPHGVICYASLTVSAKFIKSLLTNPFSKVLTKQLIWENFQEVILKN